MPRRRKKKPSSVCDGANRGSAGRGEPQTNNPTPLVLTSELTNCGTYPSLLVAPPDSLC